jgi:hypothetical protein
MRKIHLAVLGTIACCLTSCGTFNTVRWAYGKESIFEQPSAHSDECGLRPVLGIPVILGGVAVDAVTWPVQLAFGVWPWWGDSSMHMQPNDS